MKRLMEERLGAAVITDLAYKMRCVLRVEWTLEVVARAPQMVLGHELEISGGDHFRRHVGRAGKIGPVRIVLENHLRQNLPGDLVVRRVETREIVD